MATQEIQKIEVAARERLGSRYAARLRKSGRLPAVIYGHQQEPLHVSMDRRQLTDLLRRNTHVLEVQIDAKAEPCLIKDVQWDHLGSQIVHVDLARVDLNETVEVEVELEFYGEAIGLKEVGAIMEHPYTNIEISCRVLDIPEKIRVDVSGMKVDEPLTAGDLKLPEGIKCTFDPDTIIAVVRVVSEEEVAPVVAVEGEPAEPEVIGRPKAEEDAEAAAPAKK